MVYLQIEHDFHIKRHKSGAVSEITDNSTICSAAYSG